MIKNFIKKYFESLALFYSYLGYKVFFIFALNILVGVLGGLGLTIFLPLLQLVSDSSEVDPEKPGKMAFIMEFVRDLGLSSEMVFILFFMIIFFFRKGLIRFLPGILKLSFKENLIRRLRATNVPHLNKLVDRAATSF